MDFRVIEATLSTSRGSCARYRRGLDVEMAPDGELPLTPRPVDHLDGRV